MEKRVTLEIKSKFNNLQINGINTENCVDIKRTLSVAMKKAHAPEKLHLQFEGKMNATMIKMTEDYKHNITFLNIWAKDNEDLLLQPSFIFKSLESLYLNGINCTDDTMVCEAMIAKHANNLRILRVDYLKKRLIISDLPKLNFLTLQCVDEEAAWNILEHCRPTITRLDLRRTNMNSPPINNNSDAYEIPNIKHLRIIGYGALDFVEFNSEHLVTLDLRVDYDDDISKSFVWPQFPQLRELKIRGSECLPILINCRETLEHLSIERIHVPSDYASVVLPSLTDLHLTGVNNAFASKICSSNYRTLEFMTLDIINLPNFDDVLKIESLKNVVLMSTYTAHDRKRMTQMCPNAEVVILREGNRKEIRDQIRLRYKSRNFTLDWNIYLS